MQNMHPSRNYLVSYEGLECHGVLFRDNVGAWLGNEGVSTIRPYILLN